MTDFPIYAKDAEIILHLPNSISEIPTDWLQKITDEVNVSDHHSLIAVVYREKLSTVILSKLNKKDLKAAVMPIFIKAGKTDSDFINSIQTKDRVIISNTQLSLGYHCAVSHNELSFERVLQFLEFDTKNTYQRSLEQFNNAYVCFVDFKIVGNSDIIANYIPTNEAYNEEFVDIIGKVQGEA